MGRRSLSDRRNNDQVKADFLEALSKTLAVSPAARMARVSVDSIYRWEKEDQAFHDAWQRTISSCVDNVERTAYTMAVGGSEGMIKLILVNRRREVYGDKVSVEQRTEGKLEVSGVVETRQTFDYEAYAELFRKTHEVSANHEREGAGAPELGLGREPGPGLGLGLRRGLELIRGSAREDEADGDGDGDGED